MPLSRPTFAEELKVPSRASRPDRTRPTIALKSTKYQYSLRLDLPENTAYFFNASRYQLISNPPHASPSSGPPLSMHRHDASHKYHPFCSGAEEGRCEDPAPFGYSPLSVQEQGHRRIPQS